jgi:hypothetical protein
MMASVRHETSFNSDARLLRVYLFAILIFTVNILYDYSYLRLLRVTFSSVSSEVLSDNLEEMEAECRLI